MLCWYCFSSRIAVQREKKCAWVNQKNIDQISYDCIVIAYNIDLIDEPDPISFEVANMNHRTPIRRSIYRGEAELIKRKRRKMRNGKQTQIMEQNIVDERSTKDIIEDSNKSVHERKSKSKDPLQGTVLSQKNQDDSQFRNKEGYEKW